MITYFVLIGAELPCPDGYSSNTGFTPECSAGLKLVFHVVRINKTTGSLPKCSAQIGTFFVTSNIIIGCNFAVELYQ